MARAHPKRERLKVRNGVSASLPAACRSEVEIENECSSAAIEGLGLPCNLHLLKGISLFLSLALSLLSLMYRLRR